MSTPSDQTNPADALRAPASDLDAILSRITQRHEDLFQADVDTNEDAIRAGIEGKRILVTGAAGSIGAATVSQIIRYRPATLDAIDISENTMVELVRDLRSRPDLDVGRALRTSIVDFGSKLGERFVERVGPFDRVMHFAAMKHVRAERDVFSLSRMIETNVLGVDRFLGAVKRNGPCDVFAISSDKACRPANLMGASKRLMEQIAFWHADRPGTLLGKGNEPPLPRVACTRFANVAFSDGSLLAGFLNRIRKRQPLAGPSDVRRFFITEREAGQMCLLTAALAQSKQIFVPRLDPLADLRSFAEIAEIVLDAFGYAPRWYETDAEARRAMGSDPAEGRYPCCFVPSETTGEKQIEEFVAGDERVGPLQFKALDVIVDSPAIDGETLAEVLVGLRQAVERPDPDSTKARIVDLMARVATHLQHVETGRDLDQGM
ncbi:MAG: polysaccharide biosynthesis protein [Phycisphaerae bacterium]|nr:polysaccharide biosynthesis protein [Phycisphaerae bacterium]